MPLKVARGFLYSGHQQPTMAEAMPESNQQRAEAPEEPQGSFTNKPVLLADNSHGTKIKLWPNDGPGQTGIPNVSIERSFKRKDSDQSETQKVSPNAEDLLADGGGLEKGHDAIVNSR
jgi:hypothetical protein